MTSTSDAPGWRLELSRPAAETLRTLPRADRRTLAARLDGLADVGPPPGTPQGTVALPAGRHMLVCSVDPDARVLVVVTIQAASADPGPAVGRLARRRMRSMMMGGGVMEIAREVKQAARSLGRAPGFTLTALLTLALGIGATAGVFSVANGVLLEPLPYGEPEDVVTIYSQWSGYEKTWVSEPEYVNYWQQNRTLEDLALYFTSTHTFTDPENPELVGSAVVTANLFEVLGVGPVHGRAFTWEEGRAEQPVVMLSWEAWQRRYGGDPSVVGTDVLVNGNPYTILGVTPEGFVLPADFGSAAVAEVFFTGPVDREATVEVPRNGGSHGYYTAGRLRDGVTVEEARADIENIAARLRAEGVYDESWNFRPLVYSAADDVAGSARGTILFLLAACGFVLLIACGNVANLLLSRAEGRIRDVAVRRALGAGSGAIVRGLFYESGLLALGGGVLGLALAQFGIGALMAVNPEAVPRAANVELDGMVVAFTVAVAALTAVLFGWIPALKVARGGVAGTLHGAGRGAGANARSNRVQGLLVAGQMAMAVTLLAAAGLTMRAFVSLLQVDLGFETEGVLTARMTVPSATYPDLSDVTGFWDELVRRVEAFPGVQEAGLTRLLPLDSQMGDSGFYPVGYVPAEGEVMAADWQYVGPGYIEAMGIPVLAGRAFEDGDRAASMTVMMINEAAARRFWPGTDPLGTRVSTFGGDTATVVGVVGNLRHNGVTAEAKPRYYRAIHQLSGPGNARRMTLAIKTTIQPEEVVAPLRSLVREMDPTMPLSRVQTMEDVAGDAVAQPRFAMMLLLAFAALATTLAVVGIYGVLAYAVSRRTQEIGVRMALGADRGAVVGMVVRQGMVMAVLGVVAGTILALGLGRVMAGMLYGVAPRDPLTLTAVPLLFATVALAACWVPAARAARVPPTEALRAE